MVMRTLEVVCEVQGMSSLVQKSIVAYVWVSWGLRRQQLSRYSLPLDGWLISLLIAVPCRSANCRGGWLTFCSPASWKLFPNDPSHALGLES